MNTKNNWQDALLALKQDGNLPEGEDTTAESTKEPSSAARKGKLTVAIEKKGRGGKTVTIISGFTESYEDVADIAAQIKTRLGTGGSARGGEILIQGDRIAQVKTILQNLGYKV